MNDKGADRIVILSEVEGPLGLPETFRHGIPRLRSE